MKSNEYFTFLKELPKSFQEIGGIIPSSPALARAMVRPLREAKKTGIRILEVGPGTGPFTRRILKLMRSGDELLICEINPRFVRTLKRTLPKNKHYVAHKEHIHFYEGPVQDLAEMDPPVQFDVIVSSLPFSNFEPGLVKEILELFGKLLAPGGHVSFCEYVGLRAMSRVISPRTKRERLKGVDDVVDSWMSAARSVGKVRRQLSLFNVPPAFTFVVDKNGATAVEAVTHATKANGTNGNSEFSRNGANTPYVNGNGTQNGHGHSARTYSSNGMHRNGSVR